MDIQQHATAAVDAASTPPAIGQLWPGQGGIFMGFHPLGGYLIAAAVDLPGKYEWGGYDQDQPGATFKLDGAANTRVLIESADSHPAAKAAADYTAEGHTDFYLPSKGEIAQCQAAASEAFEKEWYWSSTQYGRDLAWCQSFDNGFQGFSVKNDELRARAVRRSTI